MTCCVTGPGTTSTLERFNPRLVCLAQRNMLPKHSCDAVLILKSALSACTGCILKSVGPVTRCSGTLKLKLQLTQDYCIHLWTCHMVCYYPSTGVEWRACRMNGELSSSFLPFLYGSSLHKKRVIMRMYACYILRNSWHIPLLGDVPIAEAQWMLGNMCDVHTGMCLVASSYMKTAVCTDELWLTSQCLLKKCIDLWQQRIKMLHPFLYALQ